MRYAFIREHRAQYRITTMCRVLRVSRAGFYAWLEQVPSARARANVALLAAIRRIHAANYQAYGARRTWQALRLEGLRCGQHRVARLRREAGIEAQRRRRFRLTVQHRHSAPAALDHLQRRFQCARLNEAWVGDMTFIRTRAGWLHLAMLLDLYSRQLVGWAMAARPTEQVALDALTMALRQQRPPAGLIHHTDRGMLYRGRRYRDCLAAHGIIQSMSGSGSAYDNAAAESFFSTLKNELVHHCDFATLAEARTRLFEYIETFYNRRRLHQGLGYRTPLEVASAAAS